MCFNDEFARSPGVAARKQLLIRSLSFWWRCDARCHDGGRQKKIIFDELKRGGQKMFLLVSIIQMANSLLFSFFRKSLSVCFVCARRWGGTQ